MAGSCLCGEVRFRLRLPALFCAHCHCSMCRRSHGAGFVTWVGVARDQLSFESGAQRLVHYRSSDHGTRAFCQRCGSSLFFETAHHPERVDVVLAALEGPIDRPPQFHVFWDHRAEWIDAPDGLPRLGGPTGFEPIAAGDPPDADAP